ncbi:MAG TPA: histone deacetylase [bacterium]|nr:histone deacetylase [bacterium]
MTKIGIVHDPLFLQHLTGPMHPERPDRLRALEPLLKQGALEKKWTEIAPRQASPEEILLVHDRQHLEEVARTAGAGGTHLDGDTFASDRSYEAALLAAGGVLEATDRVLDGEVDSAFAWVRPPGHHAEREYAMGFCLFNNVGVAAEHLVKNRGLKRVAIVDFDVHHGNATQHMFYDRPDVFYASTHRYPFYPGTGAASETGSGAGKGYNLNFPMAAGAGDAEYRRVFEEGLIPALREYKPQFLLISAGYDAHLRDPLGGMRVSDAGFRAMTAALEEVAADFCGGKSVYTLEGGYDLEGLAGGVRETLNVLTEK